MKHILVATDGSDASSRAVEQAAELAAKFDVPLTVGHVLHFERPANELARMAEVEHMVRHATQASGVNFPNVPDTMLGLFKDTAPGDNTVRLITVIGEEIVKRAVDRAKELGVKTTKTMISQGDTADAILDMIDETGTDMCVVGHRGLGRVKTMLLGSVALKVVQQAGCSVLSVR
ncbi:Universal stress protein/MT1672 [Roseovarius litorisediminis]|uniref:Universal stress protein/MT1672 n=1 Tax=Roseovarius litorisediminis TaxID=1312363 RepID=A0A1Y5TC31_9RHOB|nr:universal stress protein [Roseovarius litorisediminis]SLN58574.1 Universal stress protein/MT1672 [Roseovarius litorisediminis]